MSDLHRAVEAEVRFFTPDRTPPLSTIKERKRSRDRRRLTLAGTALSVVAVSGIAAGVNLIPTTTDRVSSVAGEPSSPVEDVIFDVLPVTQGQVDDARFGVGVDACVRLPGTFDLAKVVRVHPEYRVTATGTDAVRDLQSCVDQVVGYTAVVVTDAPPAPLLPAPIDATGVRICINLPEGGCVDADPDVARGLAIVLLDAEPLSPDVVSCLALGSTYTLTFRRQAEVLADIRVPMMCGPVTAEGKPYTLSASAAEQVERAYLAARQSPDSSRPFTDCDALRPGDPLIRTDSVCRPGAESDGQVEMMECTNGIYVRMVRPTRGDLEGIVGPTSVWRAAAPMDGATGRTPWAFANCLESG